MTIINIDLLTLKEDVSKIGVSKSDFFCGLLTHLGPLSRKKTSIYRGKTCSEAKKIMYIGWKSFGYCAYQAKSPFYLPNFDFFF